MSGAVDGPAVVDVLTELGWSRDGFTVTWEHPGLLAVTHGGVRLAVGLHGWRYATVTDADDGYLGTVTVPGHVTTHTVTDTATACQAWHDVLLAWDTAGGISPVLDLPAL